MRWHRAITIVVAGLVIGVHGALAAEGAAGSDDACLACHDDPKVTPILAGPHGPSAHAPDAGCTACHGPSEAHLRRPPRGEKRAAPDVDFGRRTATPVERQNAACIDCHRGEITLHWWGSHHETAGVGCADCHQAHAPRDPMLDPMTQFETCVGCHAKARADALKPSHHPMHDGRVACADCHAPHGGPGPAGLVEPTLNDTCLACHADLRGPFLWEHPPAREDCLACHHPHGAPHRGLLVQRTPWLCQTCHLAQFHPSTALSGTGLPGATLPSGSQNLMGRDCLNCHAQVHGSNHPSGAGLTR
jgi:DmsE family decaheme c-type cytochrome